MAPNFEGQYEDEEVKLVFRQHPIVLRRPLIIWMIILLLGALPLAFWPTHAWAWWSFGIGIVFGLTIFAYGWMSWYFSIYIVTDQRIIHIKQNGFFNRQVVELGHDKVQNVNYEIPGFMATMFHFGTIIIQTYVGDLVLETIYKPDKVHRKISHIVRESSPISEGDVLP